MTLIAILDDRATNRQIFSKLAAALEPDVEVAAFGDPLSALAWLDLRTPDLVVADYKMPHMDGAEFTRRLRQRASGADVPLIMVTAYDDREDKLAALTAGATDFLQTPVDHQEFISRARNLLQLRRHQQTAVARALCLEQQLERLMASTGETTLTGPDRLRDLLAARIADGSSGFALHVIGLDGFDTLNRTHGRSVGDTVLATVAARLRQLVRPEDVVARQQGDVFAILQHGPADELAAASFADRMRQALAAITPEGGDRPITARGGIALYPTHGASPTALLRAARLAMATAKLGGAPTRLFRPDQAP